MDVRGVDISRVLMQPNSNLNFQFIDGSQEYGPGTIILHVNSPLVPLAMLVLGKNFVKDKRVIGYWAWELPVVPSDWEFGIEFIHEIWVPSNFTAAAIRPIAQGRAVRVVPHPVALCAPTKAEPRTAQELFTVLTMFDMASSMERKNPLAAIRAFRQAFGSGNDVHLIVKASNSEVYPNGFSALEEALTDIPNYTLITSTLTSDEQLKMLSRADALVSLHRSEGFGLTIAEAMVRGIPVISTNWSGCTDFVTESTGIPIGYELIPATDPQNTYNFPKTVWADADVDAAAVAQRVLKTDPARRKTLGTKAQEFAQNNWTGEIYAALVRRHLNAGGWQPDL